MTVSRTRPTAIDKKASSIRPVERTAVGSLGTKPVSRNVIITGIERPIETPANTAPIQVKNNSGRSARYRLTIVSRIQNPSSDVLSLEADP